MSDLNFKELDKKIKQHTTGVFKKAVAPTAPGQTADPTSPPASSLPSQQPQVQQPRVQQPSQAAAEPSYSSISSTNQPVNDIIKQQVNSQPANQSTTASPQVEEEVKIDVNVKRPAVITPSQPAQPSQAAPTTDLNTNPPVSRPQPTTSSDNVSAANIPQPTPPTQNSTPKPPSQPAPSTSTELDLDELSSATIASTNISQNTVDNSDALIGENPRAASNQVVDQTIQNIVQENKKSKFGIWDIVYYIIVLLLVLAIIYLILVLLDRRSILDLPDFIPMI